MLARKQLVLISGVTLACAGVLFAEIPSTSHGNAGCQAGDEPTQFVCFEAEATGAAHAVQSQMNLFTPARLRADRKADATDF